MRKVMILALLAASVATPTAAMAQRGEGRQPRAERSQPRPDYRAPRQESRQGNRVQREAARQEYRAERQQVRQPRQPRQQQPAVVQRRPEGATRPAWNGNSNPRFDRRNGGREAAREQFRGQQPGSRGPVSRDDRVRRDDRRDNRQDWRENRRDDRRVVRDGRRDDRRVVRDDRRDDRRDWRNDRRDDRRDWRNDRRSDRGNWNRGWRNDNRYDWQRYRNTNRFVFRIQPYYSPYRGYRYNRFSIGNFLDRLFWGQNYWINDPWTYRLPAAPYGFQWVRYYNDVVLVDTYNGEIVDVIHDFFW